MSKLKQSNLLISVITYMGLIGLQGCATSELPDLSVKPSAKPARTNPAPGTGDADLRVVADLPSPPTALAGITQPIAVSDILEVSIFQVPDLLRTVQVDEGGYISLPLIGQLPAAGKSIQVLQHEIETAYGKDHLQSPSATVFVKESAGRRVTVDGEVKRAGVFPLQHSSSLLDAVALAGGFSPIADPTKVFVFRQFGGNKFVANYSVDDIRNGKRNNPSVHGGDVIVVFASQSRIALQNLKEVLGVASSTARLTTLPY